MEHFDLLIIGTGSGNSILGPQHEHLKVALVERDAFGGTCLNRGCIPSKMFVYPAELAELAAHVGPRLGVDTTMQGVDWPGIRDRVFGRIDPIAEGGERWRTGDEQPHVTVFKGSGRFTGDKTLTIDLLDGSKTTITAETIILAAGARVAVPDAIASSGTPFHTSDTIMRVDSIPDRLVVIGGGYIGAELGNVFGSFGSDVTILTRGKTLLTREDPDISERFTAAYANKYTITTGVSAINRYRAEGDEYVLDVTTDDGPATVRADAVLVAVGRIPNGDELNVEATGVALDERGYVITDEYLRTGAEGIWALGDITNPAQLKHTANAEARIVAHNLDNPDALRAVDRSITPHAVFGHPQVAAVGLTEAQAIEAGHDVVATVRSYGDAAYGWAMEDTSSVVKLVADNTTRQLLGAHIVGPQASTLIQQLIQGMTFGQTVDEMARDQLYIHPALTEVVEQALLEL